MNQKGISSILIILIIVGVLVASGLIWSYQKTNQFISQLTPQITPPDETADWKTYRNEEYGLEVKYPEEWAIQELKLFPESVVLNPPPFGILKEEFIKLLDVPSFGLITFTIEKGGEAPSIWKDSYDKMGIPEIKMGYNNMITAKRTEERTGSNNPNPSYNSRHFIRYKILTKDNAGKYFIIDIFYNSDLEDKYLNIFNQILSTFKFIR